MTLGTTIGKKAENLKLFWGANLRLWGEPFFASKAKVNIFRYFFQTELS